MHTVVVVISLPVLTEGSISEIVSQLNSLLASENERLRHVTEELQQRHNHMTSEVIMSTRVKSDGM